MSKSVSDIVIESFETLYPQSEIDRVWDNDRVIIKAVDVDGYYVGLSITPVGSMMKVEAIMFNKENGMETVTMPDLFRRTANGALRSVIAGVAVFK